MSLLTLKNKNLIKKTLSILVAVLLSLTSHFIIKGASVKEVHAAFNEQINYQGKLTDSAGDAVSDGTYHMRFRLYTTASGGSNIWSEETTSSVTDGLFSIMLGSTTALSSVDFNQTLYLGIDIGGSGASASWDGEMSPRKILGSVPSAFEAKQFDGLATTSFVRSDEADEISVTDNTNSALTITQSGSGDILNLFDGGSEVLTVLDGGNVGIGTDGPSTLLDVEGTAVAGRGVISATNDTWLNGTDTPTINARFFTSTSGTIGSMSMGKFGGGNNGVGLRFQQEEGTDRLIFRGSSSAGAMVWEQPETGAQLLMDYAGSRTFRFTNTEFSPQKTLVNLGTSGIPFNNFYTLNADISNDLTVDTDTLVVDASTDRVGIGTTSPYAKLSVAGEVVASHITATATATSTFGGPIAMTGVVSVGHQNYAPWIYSTAIGHNNNANQIYATAIGYENTASGNYSTASGYYNTASNYGTSAFGYSNTASGSYSSAFGVNNTSSNIRTTAFGAHNEAIHFYSSAFGYNNTASGQWASAFGVNNTASQDYAVAFGYDNNASQFYSLAFGTNNTASGFNSSAFGHSNTSSDMQSVAFGYNNTASASNASAFGNSVTNTIASSLMIGPSNTAKMTILSTGETQANFFTATTTATSTLPNISTTNIGIESGGTITVGSDTLLNSSGDIYATILPLQDTAVNLASVVPLAGERVYETDTKFTKVGDGVTSVADLQPHNLWALNGDDTYYTTGNVGIGTTSPYTKLSVAGEVVASHITATTTATSTFGGPIAMTGQIAVGKGTNYAPGTNANAFGYNNNAAGFSSTALGYQNTVLGNNSTAVGIRNTASGYNASSLGYQNTASGNNGSALGLQNTASGVSSTASGYYNTASGNYSSALGYYNTASGLYSTASGFYTQATQNGASVFGGGGNGFAALVNNTANSTMIGPSTNNTLHLIQNDSARLSVNGGERLRVTSSGNVGIGTTSPYAKLSVVGETVAEYFTATSTTATSTFAGGFNVGSGGLIYDHSSGNVGIKTSSPAHELSVVGDVFVEGSNNAIRFEGTSAQNVEQVIYSNGSDNLVIGTLASGKTITMGLIATNSSGVFVSNFIVTPSGGGAAAKVPFTSRGVSSQTGDLAQFEDSSSNVLSGIKANGDFYIPRDDGKVILGASEDVETYFDGSTWIFDAKSVGNFAFNNGNVGIGTTSPYAKLSVVGETVAEYFTATSTTATSTFAGGFNVGSGGLVYDYSSGNVGIGTDSPSSLLNVAGKVSVGDSITSDLSTRALNIISTDAVMNVTRLHTNYAPAIELKAYNSSGTTLRSYWDMYVSDGGGSNNNFAIRDRTTVARTRLLIDADGNVGIGTTAPGYDLEVDGGSAQIVANIKSSNSAGTALGIENTSAGGHQWLILSAGSANTSPGSLSFYDETANKTGLFLDASDMSLRITRDALFSFSSNDSFAASAADTGFSRLSAGVIAIGDGDQGDTTGTLIADTIGIGTTSPYAKLSVVGETVAEYFTATSTTATSTFAGGLNVGSGGLVYDYSSGNVGIGTTSPSAQLAVSGNSYLGGRLDVIGESTFHNHVGIGGSSDPRQSLTVYSSGQVALSQDYATYITNTTTSTFADGSDKFGLYITSTGTWSGGDNYGLYVDAPSGGDDNIAAYFGGNVGIGATDPTTALTVAGDHVSGLGLVTLNSTTHSFISLNATSGNDSGLILKENGSSVWQFDYDAGANYFKFYDYHGTPGVRMVIQDSTGNVGIGTTSPYAKLSVVGETVAEYFTATSTTATSTFPNINIGSGALTHDSQSGITSISNIELGALTFETDSGIVSWVDMPVSSTPSAGTVQSYSAQIDGNPIFTVYSEADGSGGIENYGFGIGTTTPNAKFAIDIAASDTPLMRIASSTDEYFLITADGKIGVGSSTPTYLISLSGGAYSDGSAWSDSSSETFKEGFEELDKSEILSKIRSLNITKWNYKNQDDSIKHIGPISEQFYELFEVGRNNQSIASLDTAGVALLGIQALAQKIENLGLAVVDGVSHFTNLIADKIYTKELCLDDVCIDKDDLKALLDHAGIEKEINTTSTSTSTQETNNDDSNNNSSSGGGDDGDSANDTGTSTDPVIDSGNGTGTSTPATSGSEQESSGADESEGSENAGDEDGSDESGNSDEDGSSGSSDNIEGGGSEESSGGELVEETEGQEESESTEEEPEPIVEEEPQEEPETLEE